MAWIFGIMISLSLYQPLAHIRCEVCSDAALPQVLKFGVGNLSHNLQNHSTIGTYQVGITAAAPQKKKFGFLTFLATYENYSRLRESMHHSLSTMSKWFLFLQISVYMMFVVMMVLYRLQIFRFEIAATFFFHVNCPLLSLSSQRLLGSLCLLLLAPL